MTPPSIFITPWQDSFLVMISFDVKFHHGASSQLHILELLQQGIAMNKQVLGSRWRRQR
jgi:hypothetical protein